MTIHQYRITYDKDHVFLYNPQGELLRKQRHLGGKDLRNTYNRMINKIHYLIMYQKRKTKKKQTQTQKPTD